ncbi:MAG: bacterial Ig-like domain-containing protein, partial [Muribaculaceae bacterium]|nr:bacterial Ig-like domain-containing protein [Muribaculaceae bacterium]
MKKLFTLKLWLLLLALTASLTATALTADDLIKVTDITTLSTGDKVVIAMAVNSSGVTGWNGTKDATISTTMSEWVQYEVTVVTSGVNLYDASAGKYIASPGSTNQFVYGATPGVCSVSDVGVLKCNSRYLYKQGSYIRMYTYKSDYTPFYVFKINLSEPTETPVSIAVTGEPAEFWKGDAFNHDGMTVTATYGDESTVDVTNWATFTAPDMTTKGEKTVNVSYKELTASYTINVQSIENTIETAYTADEARSLIDANKDLATPVYVKGKISRIDGYSDSKRAITYWISEDGTELSKFQIYLGKNINNTEFNSVNDIVLSADVVVFGKLKKYSAYYELDEGNYLVSYEGPKTTVYCRCEQGWWTQDGAAVGVHYWGGHQTGTTWPGIRMTPVEGESGLWVAEVPCDITGVIFTRMDPNDIVYWGAKTADLTLPNDGKNCFTITSTEPQWESEGKVAEGTWGNYPEIHMCNITWSVNGETTTGEQVQGAAITFPEDPMGQDEYEFRGWTASSSVASSGEGIEYLADGATVPEEAEVTYYAVFAKRSGFTHNFADMEGFDSWTSTYSEHTDTFDDGVYVELSKANKQGSTITDCPVTKGDGEVIIKAPEGVNIVTAKLVCKQWGSKPQTITLHTSTDGENFSETENTSSNFTLDVDNVGENIVAIKYTFDNVDNQIGLSSFEINKQYQDYCLTFRIKQKPTILFRESAISKYLNDE